MDWRSLNVAAEGTHHVLAGKAAYANRFDEALKFHDPGLAAVRRQQEAWHIRPDGRAAYERRFRRTFGYYEGLAAVEGTDGWRHITPLGEDAYHQRHAWCGNFQGGRCTVRTSDGKYFHINHKGAEGYSETWRYAGDYRDGIAVIQAIDGRSTHIDLEGKLLHNRWFIDLDVFHKGFARARDEHGWMHINQAGVPLYARRFAQVEPFYNGQARVERFDGALEVVNESGVALIELRAG